MTQPYLFVDNPASPGRRGGVRGTRAASGSPPAGLPLLLDSRELARLLGIGRTKAFDLMAREQVPVVRIGRCVRVSRAALEEWIADRVGLQSGGGFR